MTGYPTLPWLLAQRRRALGFGLLVAGATVAVVGWISVSGSSNAGDQAADLVSAGVGSLMLLGTGVELVLDAGLRDEQCKLAELAEFTSPANEPGHRPATGSTGPVLIGGGLATLIVGLGWNQAATAAGDRGAIPGIALGITGVIMLTVVAAAHLLRLRAGVAARKAAVLGSLADRYRPSADAVHLTAAPADGPARPAGMFLVAPGLTRFHRPGCPTLAEVEAIAVAGREVDPALRPCQICEATR